MVKNFSHYSLLILYHTTWPKVKCFTLKEDESFIKGTLKNSQKLAPGTFDVV